MVKSDKKLREVIEKMEAERILDLAKILKLYDPDGDKNFAKKTRDEQVSALCNEISSVGGHSVANFFRGKGVSYREVITDVAVHLKVELKPAMTVAEMEGAIAQKALQQLLEKLTPEQREELAESIEQEAAKYGKSFKKEGGVLTALALGQMSGFTIYLAASTVVGALTGFLGITLSFGFYAGMSSAISVIIGPVGWTVLGMATIYKIGTPNMKKLLPSVLLVAAERQLQAGMWETNKA